jgi:hypothetical protein
MKSDEGIVKSRWKPLATSDGSAEDEEAATQTFDGVVAVADHPLSALSPRESHLRSLVKGRVACESLALSSLRLVPPGCSSDVAFPGRQAPTKGNTMHRQSTIPFIARQKPTGCHSQHSNSSQSLIVFPSNLSIPTMKFVSFRHHVENPRNHHHHNQ